MQQHYCKPQCIRELINKASLLQDLNGKEYFLVYYETDLRFIIVETRVNCSFFCQNQLIQNQFIYQHNLSEFVQNSSNFYVFDFANMLIIFMQRVMKNFVDVAFEEQLPGPFWVNFSPNLANNSDTPCRANYVHPKLISITLHLSEKRKIP